MVLTAITAMMLLAEKPTTVTAPIVAASMFKNGFAVVLREFFVKGAGEYDLESMPAASMGTLWFSALGGLKLDGISTVSLEHEVTEHRSSIEGILLSNVGKKVRLGMKNGDEVTGTSKSGKLVSFEGEIAILETDQGTLVIPKASITSVSGDGGSLEIDETLKTSSKALRFKLSGTEGKIQILSMERGLTWTPSYLVDVSDKKNLKLIAKCTVINDLEDLNSIPAKFITGFPNVPYAGMVDPLTAQTPADQFVDRLNAVNGSLTSNSMAGGRIMGGQGLLPEGITTPSYDPSDSSFVVRGTEEAINGLRSGQQIEDLFFYKQAAVSLKKGDRSYTVLFSMEAPYEDLYCWDMTDTILNNTQYQPISEAPGDVWHALTFQNTSGQPFTTAVATTTKDGEILGQDTLHYVSPKGKAELRITKSLDVRAEAAEAEVSRERGAIKNPGNHPLYDLVTLKGTLAVTNYKPSGLKLRIRKDFTGEYVTADDTPEATKTAKGLLQVNPTGRMVWNLNLKAGEKRKITYTYKLYVKSNQ